MMVFVLTINLQGCLSLLSTAWARIKIENAVMFQGCLCIGRVVQCPVPFSQIGSKLSIYTKAKNIQFHLWRAYEINVIFFSIFSPPKKVSKHLCSYNCMSLVLIGCMKLDLFANSAKSLLAGVFVFFFFTMPWLYLAGHMSVFILHLSMSTSLRSLPCS